MISCSILFIFIGEKFHDAEWVRKHTQNGKILNKNFTGGPGGARANSSKYQIRDQFTNSTARIDRSLININKMKMLHCVSPLLNAPKHTFFRVTIVSDDDDDGAQQRVDMVFTRARSRQRCHIKYVSNGARGRERKFIHSIQTRRGKWCHTVLLHFKFTWHNKSSDYDTHRVCTAEFTSTLIFSPWIASAPKTRWFTLMSMAICGTHVNTIIINRCFCECLLLRTKQLRMRGKTLPRHSRLLPIHLRNFWNIQTQPKCTNSNNLFRIWMRKSRFSELHSIYLFVVCALSGVCASFCARVHLLLPIPRCVFSLLFLCLLF